LPKEKFKAFLIGAALRNKRQECLEMEASMEELKLLSDTNEFEIIDCYLKKISKVNPRTHLTSGHVEELKLLIKESRADVVVFDGLLSGSQIKNLEEAWKVTVIDRRDLILDIFEKHATTKEAELQIELARLEMLLPRLVRMWTHLDRQAGGIGLRGGEGEKQIERDRREIKKKISVVKKKLKKVEINRDIQQKARSGSFRIALVGYTNAGKSTLMNILTQSKVYAADKLFATLDPRTRQWPIQAKSGNVLITDTIGFIRNLPHSLIASFKSTLMEAANADLIWHVVDYSHPDYQTHKKVVLETLKEIGIKDKPIWNIYNKIDQIEEKIENQFESDDCYISAQEKIALDFLEEKVQHYINY